MFGLSKKNKKYPPFNALKLSPDKNKFFVRTCQWRWLNKNSIIVSDKHQPRVITLDPWPQLVFLAAKGDKTISEFIFYMATKYADKIPDELDSTILEEIRTLLSEKIIELTDQKIKLSKDILKPLL